MNDTPNPHSDSGANRPRMAWPALLAILLILAFLAAAFAWVGGRLAPARLTPARFADAIEKGNGQIYPGYRRAHAKGVCVVGYFEGNGEGKTLSRARIFEEGRTPFIGRMSIGGGTPYGLDGKARVRSMALQLNSDDGQQWRMAMNSFPFFGVSTVQAFYAQTVANAPDPATGKPDPEKVAAFVSTHPAAARFAAWAKTAPWSTSWANTAYNGVNTFRFTNAEGKMRNVRWSMQPQTAFEAMSPEQRELADDNFLASDLAARLAQGPVRWDMVVTLAAPGDAVDDASLAWPENRERVTVGKVVVERSSPQASGACRDINYDPLVLPVGVSGSGDPVLAARSAVYSVSFNRRERDIALGKVDAATGHAKQKETTP